MAISFKIIHFKLALSRPPHSGSHL
uniref:Uncharacterized protein n=1 Tax=Moniliophthora roreri TaxID=221103 RepID=A0A0W0GCE1_MONRR